LTQIHDSSDRNHGNAPDSRRFNREFDSNMIDEIESQFEKDDE
jgi:hypothetical protein